MGRRVHEVSVPADAAAPRGLTLALRAANNPVKDKIFKNMSSRAAEGLREDMETKGPAKLTDIERAQQKILQTVRRLEEEGKIVVGGAGAEAMV